MKHLCIAITKSFVPWWFAKKKKKKKNNNNNNNKLTNKQASKQTNKNDSLMAFLKCHLLIAYLLVQFALKGEVIFRISMLLKMRFCQSEKPAST